MPTPITFTVHSYDVDMLGHANHITYHRFAEHARSELLAAAGAGFTDLAAAGRTPVLLETNVRFLGELWAGESVIATSRARFDDRPVFDIDTTLTRADGSPSAELHCVLGMFDLATRKLLRPPAAILAELGVDVEMMR